MLKLIRPAVLFILIALICFAGANVWRWQAPFVSREIAEPAHALPEPAQKTVAGDIAAIPASTPGPHDFYVSPTGSPNANGRFKDPWDLGSALKQTREVKPGNTIWLRGGIYEGTFTSNLSGTAAAPIIVRNFPGERAILDRAGFDPTAQAALTVNGSFVWFWGLEVTNSYPDRSRTSPFTSTVKAWRGPGIYVQYGTNCKLINMIIHDNNTGIYDKQNSTEIYGCLIYFNGNNGFGHGIYIGNDVGTKLIKDCLIFDNGGLGIQSYSANLTSGQKSIRIEGNACFNNGAITHSDQNSTNILVGAEAGISAERISLISNYVYAPPDMVSNKSKGIRLGQVDRNNKDVVVRDNYIACKVPLTIQWWDYVEMQGNIIYTPMSSINLQLKSGGSTDSYSWRNNTYISGRDAGPVFTINSTAGFDLLRWRQQTRLDANSNVIQNSSLRPSGTKVFVRSNKYEVGRGHIIVFNWDLNDSVKLDISTLGLHIGERYEVRDAQNYFGAPVASGTYEGQEIRLPMKLAEVTRPIGTVERIPTHTAPEFAAFVFQKITTTQLDRRQDN